MCLRSLRGFVHIYNTFTYPHFSPFFSTYMEQWCIWIFWKCISRTHKSCKSATFRITGMLIVIFHMKMNGKIAYGGCSYVEKMRTLSYFCENIANVQAGFIPVEGWKRWVVVNYPPNFFLLGIARNFHFCTEISCFYPSPPHRAEAGDWGSLTKTFFY